MKTRNVCALIAFLAGASPCLAQSDAAQPEAARAARNAVYWELFGNGGVYSFNYERMLKDDLGLRIGYATWRSPLFWQGGSPPDRYTTVPVTVSYLLGHGERKLELGGGVTFGRGTLDGSSSLRRSFSFQTVTAIFGYRSHPPGRGYLFRAGVTPFYSFDEGEEDAYPDPGFTFSVGVSFGYRF